MFMQDLWSKVSEIVKDVSITDEMAFTIKLRTLGATPFDKMGACALTMIQ